MTATGDRLVMLGLDGGPVLYRGEAEPAIALVVDDAVYLVDCGADTARQVVESGLTFGAVREVFITHHHLDHTAGLTGLVLGGWTTRPTLSGVGLWGPPDMAAMAAGLTAGYRQDVELFAVGGFPPFPTVHPHDVVVDDGITRVVEDDRVVVDATRVFHGPEVADAYAYRFTVKRTGAVVVFSGDTAAPDANLIELAQGCDVLVHEAQDNERVDELAARLGPEHGPHVRQHLYEAHSNVLDVPAVAQAADAQRLVLCHYTPIPQPPEVYLRKAQEAARAVGYDGEIVAPSTLDVVPLQPRR